MSLAHQFAVGEEAAPPDRRDRRQRRREDRVPRHADGHAHAARRPAAIDRPRADVDFAAANHDDGTRHGLVPGKNGRPRPNIGTGCIVSSIAGVAAGRWSWQFPTFRAKRWQMETERAGRYPAIRSLLAKCAAVHGRWPMPSGCRPATMRRTSSRSSCCR